MERFGAWLPVANARCIRRAFRRGLLAYGKGVRQSRRCACASCVRLPFTTEHTECTEAEHWDFSR